MPDFKRRSTENEQMDDPSITDERLTASLEQLERINRWLGGRSATMKALAPFLARRQNLPTRILDVGAGIGDFAAYIAQWGARRRLDLHVTAVDLHPATVAHANATLDGRLPHFLRDRIRVEVADARKLAYKPGSFDVAVCSLFLHHLSDEDAIGVLSGLNKVARHGIIVNDLHRTPAAYAGFKLFSSAFPVTPMIAHDGAVSVLRGFTKRELLAIAQAAGLENPRLSWRWAFRWVMSTLR